MDKLRSMETFIAVVESGSFTGAAGRLEMSAVMVGKYIALLESQLGTRLLERNTRRQSLTDAGRVYFDEAKRVLEQVSIAESAVERLRAAPAGTLRVTAPTSFGGCVIAPLTATFLQRYPDVRVELDLTNRMVDLVDEGVDLAIRIGDIHNDDLVAKYLCPYRMVICAAPAYLARYGTPRTPADLADHLCLSHTVWTARNEWRLPGGKVRCAGSAMPFCAATMAMGYGWRRERGRDYYCNPKCWWQKSWRAAGWCRCWRTTRLRHDRYICCGARIYVRYPSSRNLSRIFCRARNISAMQLKKSNYQSRRLMLLRLGTL